MSNVSGNKGSKRLSGWIWVSVIIGLVAAFIILALVLQNRVPWFNEIITKISSFFSGLNSWWAVIVSLVVLGGVVWFIISASKERWETSTIAEIGIACALSLILGYFKIFQMPEGGSVSLAMLPVVVVALRKGTMAGVACGVIAGLLQYLPDPYFLNPIQFLLDYPMAWGALGFAGLAVDLKRPKLLPWIIGALTVVVLGVFIYGLAFDSVMYWDQILALGVALLFLLPGLFLLKEGWPRMIAGLCLGAFGRFAFHFLAGVFYFVSFKIGTGWERFGAFAYVALYIASHLVFETLICGISIVPLMRTTVVQNNTETNQ